MEYKELKMEGHYCYWCGKEMKREYSYSDRCEWYECDCEQTKEWNRLKHQIKELENKLLKMKQSPDAIDTLYSYKIKELEQQRELLKR